MKEKSALTSDGLLIEDYDAALAAEGESESEDMVESEDPESSGGSTTLGNISIPELEEYMTDMSEQQKMFVAELLTPETAALIGVFLGEESFNYLAQFADPTKVLMPQSRAEVEAQLSSAKPQQEIPEQSAAPVSPQPAAQPQPAVTQGMLA